MTFLCRHFALDQNVSGELDNLDWSAGPRSNGSCNSGGGSLTLDDDFYMDFSDTLFSSLTSNQPFAFPNPREIAKGAGLADFIQPGLVQLQPNLDDFMDTLEPFHGNWPRLVGFSKRTRSKRIYGNGLWNRWNCGSHGMRPPSSPFTSSSRPRSVFQLERHRDGSSLLTRMWKPSCWTLRCLFERRAFAVAFNDTGSLVWDNW